MGTQCPGKPGSRTWGAGTWVTGTAAGCWDAWDPEESHSGTPPSETHRVMKKPGQAYGREAQHWRLLCPAVPSGSCQQGRVPLTAWVADKQLTAWCRVVLGGSLGVDVTMLLASVAPPSRWHRLWVQASSRPFSVAGAPCPGEPFLSVLRLL